MKDDPNQFTNCFLSSNDGNVFKCRVCDASYYPYKMNIMSYKFCVPRDFYLISSPPLKLKSCLIYDTATQMCVACDFGFVIDIDGYCQSQCSPGAYISVYSLDTTNVSNVVFQYYKKCVTGTPSLASDVFDPQSPNKCYGVIENAAGSGNVCAICAPSQIGVNIPSFNQSNFYRIVSEQIMNIYPYSESNVLSTIQSCVSRSGVTSGITMNTQTLVGSITANIQVTFVNCRIAGLIGTSNRYGCLSCQFGFTGQIVKDLNSKGYVIDRCAPMADCVTTYFAYGLGSQPNQLFTNSPPLDFFASCHKCTDSTKIPTFPRTMQAITAVTPNIPAGYFGSYNVPTDQVALPYAIANPTGKSIQCQAPGLGMTVVSNCSI